MDSALTRNRFATGESRQHSVALIANTYFR